MEQYTGKFRYGTLVVTVVAVGGGKVELRSDWGMPYRMPFSQWLAEVNSGKWTKEN